jgi:TMEM175 potassium channel family protein
MRHPYSCPVAEDDESDRPPGASEISHRAGDNSLGRLLALSDGVFAIAMTLLALDLRPPSLSGHVTSEQLMHALAQHTDSYWSFILSFYVIAIYWGGHRRLMRSVVVFNLNLVRDTIFLLLIVAALPFPTSVLGQYGGTGFALALYGAINALATLALIALTYDVRRADRVARKAETPADQLAAWEGWLNLGVFLLCIPAGYLFGGNGPFVLLLLVLTNRLPLLRRLALRYRIGPWRHRR